MLHMSCNTHGGFPQLSPSRSHGPVARMLSCSLTQNPTWPMVRGGSGRSIFVILILHHYLSSLDLNRAVFPIATCQQVEGGWILHPFCPPPYTYFTPPPPHHNFLINPMSMSIPRAWFHPWGRIPKCTPCHSSILSSNSCLASWSYEKYTTSAHYIQLTLNRGQASSRAVEMIESGGMFQCTDPRMDMKVLFSRDICFCPILPAYMCELAFIVGARNAIMTKLTPSSTCVLS